MGGYSPSIRQKANCTTNMMRTYFPARLAASALVLPLLLLPTLAVAQTPAPVPVQDVSRSDIEVARQKVYPALVNIAVVFRFFNGGRAQRSPAGGSGVIVSPDGKILTNFHVAGNTTRIVCTLPTGESMEAKVLLHDPMTDLSVLQIINERRTDPKLPLPYAALGNSDEVQVGDTVLAIGNPLLLSSSITKGIVSNTKRVFTDFTSTQIEDQELDGGERTGVFTRWIQHDALILPGNSGGPLVNLKGEVIGINELGGGGIGFAIPSNIAKVVLESAAKGEVTRATLGITVLPVGKLGRTDGALISAVTPGSASEKAGIKPGDILTELNGKPVTARFFEEIPLLYQTIAALPIGSGVSVKVLRDNAPLSLNVPVTAMEKTIGKEEELREMGISVQEITEPMRISRRLETKDGVLLTGVRPGYPFESAQPQIQFGDLLTQVNGKPVKTIPSLREALKGANKDGFLVQFLRGREKMVSVVKLPENKTADENTELPRAWLGVRAQVMTTELAKALGMESIKGFRVTEVLMGSSAQKAGIAAGDVITAVNKELLNAYRPQDAEDLRRTVEDLPLDQKAVFTVIRNGNPLELSTAMVPLPAGPETAKKARQKQLEFSVRDLTPMDVLDRRLPANLKGVLVTEVTPGGWANIGGLQVDDILLASNGQLTETAEGFERVMANLLKSRPKVVQLFIRRGERTHFVFLEPDWQKLLEAE